MNLFEVVRNQALVASMVEILENASIDGTTFRIVLSNVPFAAEWWHFVIFEITTVYHLERFLIANISQVS
jgi:hypothetical protein